MLRKWKPGCPSGLLIVLNGIEKYEMFQKWKEIAQLLIVLNGIENFYRRHAKP